MLGFGYAKMAVVLFEYSLGSKCHHSVAVYGAKCQHLALGCGQAWITCFGCWVFSGFANLVVLGYAV